MEETPYNITTWMEDASEDVAEDVVMADTGSNQVFSPAKTMEKVPSNITAEIEDIVMVDAQSMTQAMKASIYPMAYSPALRMESRFFRKLRISLMK